MPLLLRCVALQACRGNHECVVGHEEDEQCEVYQEWPLLTRVTVCGSCHGDSGSCNDGCDQWKSDCGYHKGDGDLPEFFD